MSKWKKIGWNMRNLARLGLSVAAIALCLSLAREGVACGGGRDGFLYPAAPQGLDRGRLSEVRVFAAGQLSGGWTPADDELLKASLRRLVDRLMEDDCAEAIGSKDSPTARRALWSTFGFADLGSLRVVTAGDGRVVRAHAEPPVSQYRPAAVGVDSEIRLNAQVNWVDPDRTLAVDQAGGLVVYPLLKAKAHQLGVASMTAGEFMDLTLLHELGHYFGLRHLDNDARAFDRKIWRSCFK